METLMWKCRLVAVALAALGTASVLEAGLGDLATVTEAETRCVSPENRTGEKGRSAMAAPSNPVRDNENNASKAATDLGRGWKVNPYLYVKPKETLTLMDVEGPGTIRHIWMTLTGKWRWSVIRMYWDGETEPSVEVPAADFFCMGWNEYAPVSSATVCVNPGSAFNCYWPMPFRKHCRITLENLNPTERVTVYYYVDYEKGRVPDDQAYFHAQFRTTPSDETGDYTILDGVKGRGQFVGVYLAWEVHNTGWWGEGEAKFYLDGDREFPTICSTGLEDYFCGSYNFDRGGKYQVFCTPYAGLCQVLHQTDRAYLSGQRFGLYRWHVQDPVRFRSDLRMTIQDLGWRHDGRYLKQHSAISSTAFWYQSEPHASFPKFPSAEEIEVH